VELIRRLWSKASNNATNVAKVKLLNRDCIIIIRETYVREVKRL
jgi:hypothetical protein